MKEGKTSFTPSHSLGTMLDGEWLPSSDACKYMIACMIYHILGNCRRYNFLLNRLKFRFLNFCSSVANDSKRCAIQLLFSHSYSDYLFETWSYQGQRRKKHVSDKRISSKPVAAIKHSLVGRRGY